MYILHSLTQFLEVLWLTQVRCVLSIQFVLGHLKKTQPIRLNDSWTAVDCKQLHQEVCRLDLPCYVSVKESTGLSCCHTCNFEQRKICHSSAFRLRKVYYRHVLSTTQSEEFCIVVEHLCIATINFNSLVRFCHLKRCVCKSLYVCAHTA